MKTNGDTRGQPTDAWAELGKELLLDVLRPATESEQTNGDASQHPYDKTSVKLYREPNDSGDNWCPKAIRLDVCHGTESEHSLFFPWVVAQELIRQHYEEKGIELQGSISAEAIPNKSSRPNLSDLGVQPADLGIRISWVETTQSTT